LREALREALTAWHDMAWHSTGGLDTAWIEDCGSDQALYQGQCMDACLEHVWRWGS